MRSRCMRVYCGCTSKHPGVACPASFTVRKHSSSLCRLLLVVAASTLSAMNRFQQQCVMSIQEATMNGKGHASCVVAPELLVKRWQESRLYFPLEDRTRSICLQAAWLQPSG